MDSAELADAELAARIAALPPQKRILFEQLLAQRQGPSVHELSVTQQGLFFLDAITPGSALYTIAWRCRLTGVLDRDRFARAVRAVVARHAALRTRFDVGDGGPVQVVEPAAAIEVPLEDLTDGPQPQREERLHTRLTELASAGFDLRRGPLLRTVLFRLEQDRHVLALLAHHIIFDYVSTEIFLAELMRAYDGEDLGSLQLQYTDFARWQREYLRGERLAEHRDHWVRQLAGADGLLDLPADRPRQAIQSYRGAWYSFCIPGTTMDALRDLARRERVTPFMVYLAAFQVLMHRCSGAGRINVGLAVDTRNRAALRPVIGYFINAVVASTEIAPESSFVDLLDRIRRVCLDAYAHQDLPFDQVVEVVGPARSLSYNPLFQVTCALDEEPPRGVTADGLTLAAVEGMHTGLAKFDLSFGAIMRSTHTQVNVDYNTDLFDEATVARLGRCFVTLLNAIAHHPRTAISALPLLDDAERRVLTREWPVGPSLPVLPAVPAVPAVPSRAGAPTRDEGSSRLEVLRAIERWARLRPDAIAVVTAGGELSYAVLHREVERMAAALSEQGIGPRHVVGVPAFGDAGLVVAVLAVLSRGAAVMAAQMSAVEELEPASQDAVAGLPFVDGAAVAYLPVVAGHGPLAVTFAALDAAIAAAAHELGLTGSDRVAVRNPLGHPDALWELGAALLAGATVQLPATDGSPPAAAPTVAVLARGESASAGLRMAVTTADVSVAAGSGVCWAFAPPGVSGPVAWTSQPLDGCGERSIGRPGPGARLYVLDANLRPQPIGVRGELYVGGDQVALGYPDDPARTARAFVPDPFHSGVRLLRTGQWARWRPDGTISLLGRVAEPWQDEHGRHVPTRRVAMALARHPAVADAAVLIQRRRRAPAVLTAYVVAAEGCQAPGLREVQRFLGGVVPDYMLPRAVVALPRLPLDASGGVDADALAVLEPAGGVANATAPPRTAVQRLLTAAFAQHLAVDGVGVDDDFFDLGGHSLLAIQLLSYVGELFGVALETSLLFRAATPGALATELAHRLGGEEQAEQIAQSVEDVLSMSDAEVQQRLAAPSEEATPA
ncbi:condensation domain-containing protein [Dactylosporangium sp. NPDC051484]|uniref:non-ribosomal peptide synthetase n=1 Tax=Dactylosporangium sp. NPDC051484 TaxID=3154942 RepID=UPI00344F32BC